MGRVIGILLVLSVAVGLALLMRINDGNVALLWPPYRVDVSMNLVLLGLFGLFAALHAVLLVLSNAFDFPQRVRQYRGRRSRDAAVAGLRDGLVAFNEGRYGRAERLLQPVLGQSDLAGAAALIAARAAHRQREPERVDRWLNTAGAEKPTTNAALMVRAELAVDDRRPADAVEAVERLHARGARHLQAMRLALRAHEQSGNWLAVLQVMRQLDKRDVLNPGAIHRGLKIRALRELIAQRTDDAHALLELLATMPSAERDIDEVTESLACALVGAGRADQGSELLTSILDRRLSERLVTVYASIAAIDPRTRLRAVEAWRQRYGDCAAFTIAAGRLCAAQGLWGKAEEFLRLADLQSPDRQTRALLARLLDHLGRPDEALRYWRLAAIDGIGDSFAEWPPAPLAAVGSAAPPVQPDAPGIYGSLNGERSFNSST